METKSNLRRKLRKRLSDVSEQDRASCGRNLVQSYLQSIETSNPSKIGGFLSLSDELDLDPLLRHLMDLGKSLAVPTVLSKDPPTLTFRPLEGAIPQARGHFGIREVPGQTQTPAETLDVLLVPGLAFSSEGFRLGRGKGFYDALLKDVRPKQVIGVGYAFQCPWSWAVDVWDQPMDGLLTPEGFTAF